MHEILGVSLFVFWGMHIALNRRWYASLLKGSYRPFRIMQTIINCGILVCAAFLMISGIMLSQHVFAFLGISSGANFARIAHMLASHWYFFIYVAAYRAACRDDFPPHCGKASTDCRNKNGTVYTVDTIENDYIAYAACRYLHLWFVCIYFARRMALSRFTAAVLFPRYGKRLCYILYRL